MPEINENDINPEYTPEPEQPNSAATDLILHIQDWLKLKVPALREVAEDMAQLEDWDEKTNRPPVSFPCFLLTINILETIQNGENTQQVNAVVVGRLALPPFSKTSSWMDKATIKKGLKLHDLELAVYTALQGVRFQDDRFTPLRRVGSDKMERQDPINVRVMRFETTYYEESAKPQDEYIPLPAANITAEVEAIPEAATPGRVQLDL